MKAGTLTPATRPVRVDLGAGLGRSMKAGVRTPATPLPAALAAVSCSERSMKAGVRTPATRRLSRCPTRRS